MKSENQKGFIGTIIFHGILFLGFFLMSFAGGNGGGNNTTGEAMGGVEVSLGEPDLGGNDAESGYVPEQTPPQEFTENPVMDETLTEDDADAPVLPEKKEQVKKTPVVSPKPVITPPVYKPTKPNPTPQRIPDSKGLFRKGGNSGDGTKPGNEGRPDGSIFGDKDGDHGDGTGPGNGNGDGGPGNGPGNGPGEPGNGPGVKFDLSGFRRNHDFNIEPNRAGSGTVIIELCVFPDGKIKSVKHRLGGTMTDKYFIDLALKAVRENSYSPTGNVTSDKCGVVKFTFKTR